MAKKTCLHLAVLNIGKVHSSAVAKETEEIEAKKRRGERKDDDDDNYDDDSDDDYNDDEGNSPNSMQERGSSRHVLQFLINAYPWALVIESSFNATPVDTVLEKHKPLRTKKKEVTIYGLYDDPPTSRLLLISQHMYSLKFPNFPPLKKDYRGMLKELNWIVRKDAVYISIVGEPRPSSREYKLLKQYQESINKVTTNSNNTTNTTNKKNTNTTNKKNKNLKATNVDDIDIDTIFNKLTINDDDVPKNNLLARFRKQGFLDIVKTIISYI